MEFNPDLILVSAGFDAHEKDGMNHGYLSILEADYEWVTDAFVRIANSCCAGRIVSVLVRYTRARTHAYKNTFRHTCRHTDTGANLQARLYRHTHTHFHIHRHTQLLVQM